MSVCCCAWLSTRNNVIATVPLSSETVCTPATLINLAILPVGAHLSGIKKNMHVPLLKHNICLLKTKERCPFPHHIAVKDCHGRRNPHGAARPGYVHTETCAATLQIKLMIVSTSITKQRRLCSLLPQQGSLYILPTPAYAFPLVSTKRQDAPHNSFSARFQTKWRVP